MSVLLKTSDDEDPKSLAKIVHQARVRRAVVVKLIEDANTRGHRAYSRVDIATAVSYTHLTLPTILLV